MKKIVIIVLCLLAVGANAQWTPVNFPAKTSIKTIAFPDALTGYAGGTGPWLYRTVNGGISWDSVKIVTAGSSNQEIRQLVFLNANEGYLLGGITKFVGQIYKTSNGGITWTEVTPDTSLNIQSIVFTSPLKGFAGDVFERILRTSDGGATWSSFPTPMYASAAYLCSPDPSVVYGAGFDGTFNYKGVFFRSTDAGQTFSTINFSQNNTQIDAISFPTTQQGYALNYGFQNLRLFRTNDGGLTWDTIHPSVDFNIMHFTTADTGFVIGADGDLYMTPDKGLTYNKVYDADTLKNLQTLYFKGSRGYAAGANGTLVRWGAAPNSTGKISKPLLLQCYPNPANTQARVVLNDASHRDVQVQVMNLQGQVVWEQQLKYTGEISIPVAGWSAALYQLRIADAAHVYQGKMLVQH